MRDLAENHLRFLVESIVRKWESIEDEAARFQEQFGVPDETREAFADSCRDMLGGEEVYLAAKQVMEERYANG